MASMRKLLAPGSWLLALGHGAAGECQEPRAASQELLLLAVVFLAALPLPARAENDYEFAKLLMDHSVPDFETDDLVEHLVAQLERAPATKTEAKLIKALLERKQAATPGVSLDKRTKLLDDAETLFKEAAGEKTFRLQSVAEKELSTIGSARVAILMKNALEREKTNPIEARKMRDEAIATLGRIADKYKAEAEALRPAFDAEWKKYKEWQDKVNKTGELPIPKDMLAKLMNTFNPWLFADKRYVATKVEQLECYDDKNPNRKKPGEELAKLCEARANQEEIMELPVIMAWYNYMCGKSYAAIQDEKKAAEFWRLALDQPSEDMAPEQKKAIGIIKKLILHDLVTMKMHAKNYGDVENIVLEARTSAELRSLFDEDAGKELIIMYAKALTLPPEATAEEYKKAVMELRVMIAKEGKGGAVTRWSNEFSRAVAEILDEMRDKKPQARPKLSAMEWYDAAHGFFLMGQNEYLKYQDFERDKSDKAAAQFEKCYAEYQDAVDYYRRAITMARSEKTDLVTRVEVEPKAWFEMGLAYIKMRHYYEAVIVYQAMRDRYLPEGRKKWLPKLDDPRAIQPRVAKAVQDLLAELDKPKEGLLAKAGTNIAYELDANLKVHNNPKDGWNPGWKITLMKQDPSGWDDSNVKDLTYLAARNEMEEALRLSKAGTEALRNKPPDAKLAEENYTLSATKYSSAGDKFLKVETSSQGYELALYKAGQAYTLAQALWVTGKLPSKATDARATAKNLGAKALAAFDKYDAYIAKAPGDEEAKTRRQNLAGMVLLARNALYSGDAQWESVIKSADDYMQWENQNQQQTTSVHVALMNKYRAQVELGAANLAPKCDPYLDGAKATMDEWRKNKKTDNRTYVYMLEALARRFNMAAFQVEKFIKEGKTEYTTAMLEAYENKVADLWAERVKMVEEAEGEEQTTLEDYARVVYLFLKTRRNREAADTAEVLLKKFDPKGEGCHIPDDEKVWQNMLAKMQAVIKYNDLTKWDRCKKDHMTLVDYMYDTREGAVNREHPEKCPEFDKFSVDLEKARKQLETIKNNYPDCQTFDSKYGQDGKSFMQLMDEEIDYRRKIEGARDVLFDKSLIVADQLEKENDAEGARRYREIASAQLTIIRERKGDTPEMKVKGARISLALGKYDDARELVSKARAELDDRHPTYFDACRLDSEVYRAQKKWKDAVEYPQFYALTTGLDSKLVKDRWPEMRAFLNECYANGIACPEALKKALKPEGESTPPSEKKTEEPKPEQPKKEEAKAGAKAQPVEEKKNP